ncbi:phage tail protein [Dyella flava]|uniref:Phage tail protein n=1 Tax=Dyella flava TaxID=1920170 RepID=A0ABS2K1N7_9GAMM|nr:tail fiber protein [Dyella flava]MBM7124789.1 phage tail protein [Dyella flava]GLQ50834.1 microcystin dependent protein [Dyella flava]
MSQQSTPYVGEIRLFAFQRIPVGWLACDGSLQSINNYQPLYVLLGTTYGGDGQTTFGLPDLRGRVPVHQGTGTGLSPRVMGQVFGTETVTLNSTQMPTHMHLYNASTAAASANLPTNAELGALTNDTMYTTVPGPRAVQLSTQSVAPAGGTGGGVLPHDNTMPTLTLSYCIAFAGIYPSQN